MTRRRVVWGEDPELLSQHATARQLDGLPMFDAPPAPQVRKMARRGDSDTSKAAAVKVCEIVTTLQLRVYQAFQKHGPMTAKVCENLAEFMDLGFSTVRKRISELAAIGWLRDTGEVESGCAVYEAVKR